jgi:UDP-N-acetylglucosamine--N-acetylmuramyl-(pentapeptide) pyrophosphoryl-undecaprenol N-acetylglucosamine transferase
MGQPNEKHIAIACGGTGGHLFPGLAIAEELRQRGCHVSLLVSPKEVDQAAVKNISGFELATLPAVGLQHGSRVAFLRGFAQSFVAARRLFARRPPDAVLAMGGFTSAPPVLAGKLVGACGFLHESNTIPGRANRFLARFVTQAFVGFPGTAEHLKAARVMVTGTPVRSSFKLCSVAESRVSLGLEPSRPVALVMGGSQGAAAINDLVLGALPRFAAGSPDLQFVHLTGAVDQQKVGAVYAERNVKAVVCGFLDRMEIAMSAATVAISRAGASSLAEIAAMQLPSLLVPYPTAADNHQFHNARAFQESHAADILVQADATPDRLYGRVLALLSDQAERSRMQQALRRWHKPQAAAEIAELILAELRQPGSARGKQAAKAARRNPFRAPDKTPCAACAAAPEVRG